MLKVKVVTGGDSGGKGGGGGGGGSDLYGDVPASKECN